MRWWQGSPHVHESLSWPQEAIALPVLSNVSQLCQVLAGLLILSGRNLGTCCVRWQLTWVRSTSAEPVCWTQAHNHLATSPSPFWNSVPSFPWNAALSSDLQRDRAQVQMMTNQGVPAAAPLLQAPRSRVIWHADVQDAHLRLFVICTALYKLIISVSWKSSPSSSSPRQG